MEEDVGVKVTVTRLRRRLSVEQSEDGASPGPSTPSKKRGGRLTAKPQLELIDENTPVSSPRKTRRKSLATEAEEKPITPSRRSTRIKSNSSIVLETLAEQATNSPRAKRAARRNSQAGSDNDGPATPVKPARRTRRDSASSVENLDSSTLIKPLPVTEMVIEEEPENEVQKAVDKSKTSPSSANAEELSPNSARKSKRLLEKRSRRSGSYKTDEDTSTVENRSLNISTASKKLESEPQDSPSNKLVKSKDISESNESLLNKIETESKISKSNHNKIASASDSAGNDKNKRTRTESWPAVNISVENDCINFSDNELTKKRNGKLDDKNTSSFTITENSTNSKINNSNTSINEKKLSRSFLDTSSKRKQHKNDTDIEDNSKPSDSSYSSTLIKPLPVAEMVIEEEPENEVQKAVDKSKTSPSSANAEEISPNSARKSKRLLEKRSRRSGSYKTDEDTSTVENRSLNISTASKKPESEPQDSPSNKLVKSKDHSESNESLLNKIETESKISKSNHNKSASASDSAGNDKNKRTRTESWPAVNISVENDSINFSDNELTKKRNGKSDKNISSFTITENSTNSKIDNSNTSINEKNNSKSFLDTSSKRKKHKNDTDIEGNSKPSEIYNELQVLTAKENGISDKDIATDTSDNSDVTKLFEHAPGNVQATVHFEDSDSNSVGASNFNKSEQLDSEDQCVPVVKHDFQENLSPTELGGTLNTDNIVLSSQVSKENVASTNVSIPKIVTEGINNSCEPMDIDETIHEEILQRSLDLQVSNRSLKLSRHSIVDESENSKRKSSISNSDINTSDTMQNNGRKKSISDSGTNIPNEKNKSLISDTAADTSLHNSKCDKRKSSISSSVTDTPEKSKNDKRKSSISNNTSYTADLSKNNSNNKSTLILSQLKDVSSTSDNCKSPKRTNEVLSKSEMTNETSNNKKLPKGNLSLNDVKGTPKQSSIQKLTMQTSTPITTHLIGTKTKTEEQKREGTKKNKSNFSKSINDTESSDNDNDYDEPSVEKNELLDDEAEEASDDYESGDSHDEEDRKYEEENEILERGETLTSDDDMSNDTDYERDSFVVSSDAEDNELLSGSGDDLLMSDNELTMSKKSKKKFNERKLKKQKNASREMFESRHKLNASDQKSPTPKMKKKRMRIDSSLLQSDEEVVVNPKKSNRMRLNSTLNESAKVEETNVSLNKSNKDKSKKDSALDTGDRQGDNTVSLKKKKSKRDSICNESTMDEKEITVCNQSTIDNTDPLKVLVKQEPKTPQKDLNISVVQLLDQEEIENVQITEGNSILNQTGTDPLQATMACEDNSDSSESEEILQNYDSVLNQLNKDNKPKFNKNNVSLNSGNKTKKYQVEPIIDQLNLTHTKKSKKNKDTTEDNSHSKTVKASKEKHVSDNEDSSDSIDLQLLFSEDNCGSDDKQKSQQNKDDDNMFIPLKKSPGKTNIRESIGLNTSKQDTSLNESSKKKKNRKSSLGPAESVTEQDILDVYKNVSMNESGIKKKKKHSVSEPTDEETQDTLKVSKNVNISLNESGIKKKNKHSISEPTAEDTQDTLKVSKNVNISLNESGIKKKKKHSISEPKAEETQDTLTTSKNINISLNESGIKKKKKHSISEPTAEETEDTLTTSKNINISLNESGIKKKKKHSISEPTAEETQDTLTASKNKNISLNESGIKKKKKHSISEPTAEETQDTLSASKNVNVSLNESGIKKKKKHSLSEPTAEETQGDTTGTFFIDKTGTLQDNKDNTIAESNPPITPKSEKKKKKQKLEALVHDEDSDGAPDEAPYQSEKASEMESLDIENVGESGDSAKKKHKKKKKKKSAAASNQSGENIDTETENIITSNSKKRKRKPSNADSQESEDAQVTVEIGKHNELVGSSKKRKISHNEDNTSGSSEYKNSKKNKKKNHDVNFQDTASTSETTETQVKKNKKRKHRDDDGDNKQTKVQKDRSFQEVHVPRLPDSILRQLDDKPRKTEPAKVISTSNFIVENARQKRAKPSNYLEESIYLDEKSPLAKKQKQRIKKPKVLPFIPTASISDSGYTTNFKINKLSQTTTFEAEPVVFSKETYLQKNNIKRLGTYDRYKKQMHHKMSKF